MTEQKCKNCGLVITYNGVFWVDVGLVFPQYCPASHNPDGKRIHSPGNITREEMDAQMDRMNGEKP